MIKKRGEKVIFKRPYDPVTIVPHSHGLDVEDVYQLERDVHYNSIYKKTGEKNIQEYVNSFKTGCSLKAILDRCNLMPVRDKVSYLQQSTNGFSADLSAMPKDGVEAHMLLNELHSKHPDIVERIRKGESFDAILKSFAQDPKPSVMENQTNTESEVLNNG